MKNSHNGSKSFSLNQAGRLQKKIWDRLNAIKDERPERFRSIKNDKSDIPPELKDKTFSSLDENLDENFNGLGLTVEQVLNEIKEDTAALHPRNGTHESYIAESFFQRISRDWYSLYFTIYGWHMNGWSDFDIIGPKSDKWNDMRKQVKFSWEDEPWEIKNPCVIIDGDKISVEFFTYTMIEDERVIFEQDIYLPGLYEFESKWTVIAHGGSIAVH